MYEDPKKPFVIALTTEQHMLASLVRIEGLLEGLLTSAETQVTGLRHIAQALSGKSTEATPETTKRGGRRS